MSIKTSWYIAQRELIEAIRNKWLIVYTIGFSLLALALSRVSLASAGYAGLGGFGRTAASLINALLLFVPLLGMTIGAGSIAGDRERGTLLYLLAQPVGRSEVFWGKVIGNILGTSISVVIGFGLAALALSTSVRGDILSYMSLLGYTFLLLSVSLSMGFLVSVFAKNSTTAIGAALLIWLLLAIAGDLVIIGGVFVIRPTPANLLTMLLINPLQIFKLGAVYALRATLDTLGPVGQYAVHRFGHSLSILLSGLLVLWTTITIGTAFIIFNKRVDF